MDDETWEWLEGWIKEDSGLTPTLQSGDYLWFFDINGDRTEVVMEVKKPHLRLVKSDRREIE